MDVLVGEPWPSARALQQEWLENLARRHEVRQGELLSRLVDELTAPVPESYFALFSLAAWQWWKRWRASRFYASLHLFLWQQALGQVQPIYAAGLLRLLRYQLLQHPKAGVRQVARLEQHLALYAVLTDNVSEAGYLRIAHHVVQNIFGDLQRNPTCLIIAVQLADYLDRYYEQQSNRLQRLEITP
ncbi:MAG: hypothetical protein HQM06_13175 [Magnetococcales bacterium]|nr:hypothetical protein [Magnetococcales bacterium]